VLAGLKSTREKRWFPSEALIEGGQTKLEQSSFAYSPILHGSDYLPVLSTGPYDYGIEPIDLPHGSKFLQCQLDHTGGTRWFFFRRPLLSGISALSL
jgi:hypothetical protein